MKTLKLYIAILAFVASATSAFAADNVKIVLSGVTSTVDDAVIDLTAKTLQTGGQTYDIVSLAGDMNGDLSLSICDVTAMVADKANYSDTDVAALVNTLVGKTLRVYTVKPSGVSIPKTDEDTDVDNSKKVMRR